MKWKKGAGTPFDQAVALRERGVRRIGTEMVPDVIGAYRRKRAAAGRRAHRRELRKAA